MQQHALSVLVENEPGVLSRVVGLFSGRGFNIHSLNVAPSHEEGVSHITITTEGDSLILEQIIKQLHKIVSVLKVVDYEDIPAVSREMMFVKVQAEGPVRGEILRTVEIFRCKVVDVSHNEMIIEATGNHDKLEAIISLLQRFGIRELARTGAVAMRRSKKTDQA
ncbi:MULTISPECIES: acetolactate synthase small subunit [unclassified Desulfovibrio]|uniref:acetolactate synthase small subunit n=1 Tax=unclassified Desulfovibrio TaxID=2593640 RepID=UPI000F5E9E0B|nr:MULTISPECIES: acetolactate synthase small subunit [unclassified Desulfovibrio]RRD70215.1 acetolactate synthase small subunit [Desulfovibrio sp. OH1209_COT-279]RRD86737.1 acetolactate synthase small subunit [Desulfovibrio sp. OH1186_COT-070]